MEELYDEDYFEHGLETGKSLYRNYRWTPELTIPLASSIIDFLGIKRGQTVLDFGCAKGFLVKALRLLYRDAWGFDISNYAIKACDNEIKPYCHIFDVTCAFMETSPEKNRPPQKFDFIIAKDVLEHLSDLQLQAFCNFVPRETIVLIIIPIGDENGFVFKLDNLDVTHQQCHTIKWWTAFFEKNGLSVLDFRNKIDGIKESYYKKHPEAHGFFTLQRKE